MTERCTGDTMEIFRFSVLLGVALSTGVALAQTEQSTVEPENEVDVFLSSLEWMYEPGQTVPVGDNAILTLREGIVALDAADTAKFNEFSQNPVSGDEWLFARDDLAWIAYLSFDPIGYVEDDEEIDADATLEAIREGTEAANEVRAERGWASLNILGWRFPPKYDSQRQRLEWAIDAESGGDPVINFNTRLLGRKGVYEVVLVVDPEGLDQAVSEFNAQLAGFNFNSGHRYAEFQSGDNVAAYGLAALVAGGAAAAVAKSGLGKGLFKILAIAGLAVLVFFGGLAKKIFGRKSNPAE